MGDKLDDLLDPGERVLYRTPRAVPPSLHQGLAFAALVLGMAFATGLMEFDGAGKTILFTVLVMVILTIIGTHAECRSTQAAVTEWRVLWAKADVRQTHSVELADIERIETQARAVRVASKGDQVVVLEHPAYAPELGRALARAAGLPPPWLPGRQGEAAVIALICAVAAGALAAFVLAIKGLAAAGWIPIPFPLCLIWLLPLLLVAFAGAIAGDLLGLIALRLLLGPAELRAVLRFYAPPPEQTADFWPAKLHRRLSELVTGPPLDPTVGGSPKAGPPGEQSGHGL